MRILKTVFILALLFVFSFIPLQSTYSGVVEGFVYLNDTDNNWDFILEYTGLVYFFDLRERETFVQLTYPGSEFLPGSPAQAHIQIYDVSNNCNENNFFDNF